MRRERAPRRLELSSFAVVCVLAHMRMKPIRDRTAGDFKARSRALGASGTTMREATGEPGEMPRVPRP